MRATSGTLRWNPSERLAKGMAFDGIEKRVARHVGDMLTSNDPDVFRQGIEQVAKR